MKVLDIIACASIILGLVSAPFLLFTWPVYAATRNKGGSSKAAMISLLTFAISVVIGLCAGWTGTSIARDEVIDKLQSARDNCQISINGKAVQNSEEILAALGTLHSDPGHHSHPTKRISVVVSDKSNRIVLTLARDSDDPREYWVFVPKYWITSTKEIWRIKTSAFDAY